MPLGRVSTPILPSRYDEVLNQRVADHARVLAAAGKAAPAPLRLPPWFGRALGVAAALGMAGVVAGHRDGRQPEASVPFAKTNLVSTGAVGLAARAEDLIPASPRPNVAQPEAPTALLLPSPEVTPEPASIRSSTRSQSQSLGQSHHSMAPREITASPAQPCLTCGPNAAGPFGAPTAEEHATEVVEDESELYAVVVPALQASPGHAVAAGTRFRAVVAHPVVTSFGGTPVTATLAEELTSDGVVILSAGTLLVGEAFGTNLDDRAQLTFSMAAYGGHGAPFRGVAIGPDSRLGVPGRVVRKASRAKKGLGRVVGSLGSALALGFARERGGGVLGDAGFDLAADLASDMTQLDRTWASQRSDKGIEIRNGTELTVYVQVPMTLK